MFTINQNSKHTYIINYVIYKFKKIIYLSHQAVSWIFIFVDENNLPSNSKSETKGQPAYIILKSV